MKKAQNETEQPPLDEKSTYEQQLKDHGMFVYTNKGGSMMPLLREDRDLMVIRKRPRGRMKKYDAVLYKRGERYILHRILKVTEDGYVICGDHNYRREYDVRDEDIIGVMTSVVRDGRELRTDDGRYLLYVHLWCDFFYIRAGILYISALCRAAGRRIKMKLNEKKRRKGRSMAAGIGEPEKNERDFLYLTACGLNRIRPETDRIYQMDMAGIFRLARVHMLGALVYDALEEQLPDFIRMKKSLAGRAEAERMQRLCTVWKECRDKAIRKNLLLDAQRERIFVWFEQEGIWYMPLKGSLLKEWYPRAGMREMSDNDILFDASKCGDVRAYMEKMGFCTKSYGKGAHDEYLKEPVYNFEMHRRLFSGFTGRAFSVYYENVKDRLVKDADNRCGYHFTDDDFYIYFAAHAWKHFYGSGTGVRTLADCYIFLKRKRETLDVSYIEKELARLHAAPFEKTMRGLAWKLFSSPDAGPARLSEDEKGMLASCMSAGIYGTAEQRIRNELDALRPDGTPFTKRTKGKYLFRRLIPEMKYYKEYAPTVYRYKPLIPFFLIYRAARGVWKHGGKLWKEFIYVIKK